jgi:hypothetical protein
MSGDTENGPDHWTLAGHWSRRAVAEADPVLRAAFAAAATHFLKLDGRPADRAARLHALLARLKPRNATGELGSVTG